MSLLKRLAQQNGPPAGFQIPAGASGPPAGATGPPPGVFSGDSVTATSKGPVGMTIQDRNIMFGVTSMFLALCIAAVGGRFLSRRIIKQRYGIDDFFALGALLLFVALAIEQYLLAYNGTGSGAPSMTKMAAMGKLEFSSQITYTLVTLAAKLSILLLYRRVFMLRIKWFRIAWWSCVVLSSAYSIVLFITNMAQCAPNPPSALWRDRAGCGPNIAEAATMGYLNAFVDLTILILPIRMVWTLQMSTKQKIAIAAVFGLGFITVAVSIARAIALASPNLFTTGVLTFAVWSTAEPAAGIICACLPVMRPLFITILKTLPSTPFASWYSRTRSRKPGTQFSGTSKESSGYNASKKGFKRFEDTEMAVVRSPEAPAPAYSPSGWKQNHIGNYVQVARGKGR